MRQNIKLIRKSRKGVGNMISETFMKVYFWGAYVWFAIGFLLIAIPAIGEIKKILFTGNK